MQIAFKEISRLHTEHCHLVSSEKTAKQTKIVAELCRRMRDDVYFDNARNRFNGGRGPRWARHVDYLGKQDSEYMGRMFRFVRHWWN